MPVHPYLLIGYGLFLALMLGINLLYFFQVFKYRHPGDASLLVLSVHIVLILAVLSLSSLLLLG